MDDYGVTTQFYFDFAEDDSATDVIRLNDANFEHDTQVSTGAFVNHVIHGGH